MIRMGRGSRSDQSDDSSYRDTSTGFQYESQSYDSGASQYQPEPSPNTVTKPVTDSESMARDIKEGRLSGFVGHGTSLTGETVFQSMLRVDGHLVGSISSDSGTLIIGANGQVDANISVANATINGAVNGDISATEKIQLGRTARIIGNIKTPRLTIEEGAVLEGGCTMLKVREEVENKIARSAAQIQAPASSISETSSVVEKDAADDEDEEKSEAAAG